MQSNTIVGCIKTYTQLFAPENINVSIDQLMIIVHAQHETYRADMVQPSELWNSSNYAAPHKTTLRAFVPIENGTTLSFSVWNHLFILAHGTQTFHHAYLYTRTPAGDEPP